MGRKATPNDIFSAEQLIADVFNNANVGLAILDDQLRYLALNPRLAAIHGVSAESHLGKTRPEIIGDYASLLEPAYKQVVATGRPALNLEVEVEGDFQTNTNPGRWIVNLLPVTAPNGRVTQVWAIITEVPLERKLEEAEHESSIPMNSTVLRSWKEIADYVGACVKTVQRWEQMYGFPIRRLKPSKGSVVFALRDEVDGWMRAKPRMRNESLQMSI